MPQYSIITVNFNNAQGLQKTIESTLAQSFSDFEFFVRAYYKHKIQVKHLSFTISFYDLSGVSAKKDKINQINFERKVVHKMYLPKILVYMYYCYAALLRSKIYKNKAVSSTFDFFRNLVFRFIK